MVLFSKRNAKPKDTYIYEISQRVRRRIFHTIIECLQQTGQTDLPTVFEDAARRLLREYGSLHEDPDHPARNMREGILAHFGGCPDEQFMDFLQVCFETRLHCGGQSTVNEINHILEEENIGFELTEFRMSEVTVSGPYGGGAYYPIPPTVMTKNEKLLHRDVVQPCLRTRSQPGVLVSGGFRLPRNR